MRIIVAGSRSCSDYTLVEKELNRLTAKLDKKKLVILSGGASGADKLGERWCYENRVRYEVYPPDWHKYGKKAGLLRNQEMVDADANALIAFFDGSSPGTADTIRRARKKKLTVRIISFTPSGPPIR